MPHAGILTLVALAALDISGGPGLGTCEDHVSYAPQNAREGFPYNQQLCGPTFCRNMSALNL